jgi:hypothetical protein
MFGVLLRGCYGHCGGDSDILTQSLLVFNAAWLVAVACVWAAKYGLFEAGSPLTATVQNFDGYFAGFTGEGASPDREGRRGRGLV